VNCSIATVSFMNAMPLSRYLKDIDSELNVLSAVPSLLPSMLKSGEVDAALVPVASLLADDSLDVIADLGICADGPVRSVLLKCGKPVNELRGVAMDPASATSNQLARVLLKNHFKVDAEVKPYDDPQAADARVVIGDRAFMEEPGVAGDYDMAEQWGKLTGLPFVFAVWACRKDFGAKRELSIVLDAAYEKAVDHLESIAAECADMLGLEYELCREYLVEVIKYRIGDPEREAMTLFKEMTDRL
jgi:chorismate dehydratase